MPFTRRALPFPLALAMASGLLLASASAAAEQWSYLMNPSATGVSVMVHTDTTAAVKVRYGTTTGYGGTADPSGNAATTGVVYTVPLGGLSANTTYHYQVSVDGGTTWNADAAFTTAPLPGTAFRFGFYADFRNNPTVHGLIASRLRKTDAPQLMLNAGDVAATNTYNALLTQFFIPEEVALLRKTPFFFAPGNHEGWKGNSLAFFKPQGGADYGGYDYGDCHIVVVNNYLVSGYGAGSPQYAAIQADLAASTRAWKIAIFHNPAYTSGAGHGHGDDAGMTAMTTQVFRPHGVVLCLSGHNHFYQHNLVDGIHHVTIGSAGAPLYIPAATAHTVAEKSDYCYGVFDVTPTTLTMQVYNATGVKLDALTLTR